MSQPSEDVFQAPPLPAAAEALPASLPPSVAIPGHTAPAPVSVAQSRLSELERLTDEFIRHCQAIGGRDATIAVQNVDQALMWARRALKVA